MPPTCHTGVTIVPVDVVVVRGGSAGSTAAIYAQQALPRGRVLLLEKANSKAQRRDRARAAAHGAPQPLHAGRGQSYATDRVELHVSQIGLCSGHSASRVWVNWREPPAASRIAPINSMKLGRAQRAVLEGGVAARCRA